MVESPVPATNEPLASVCTTFSTQVVSEPKGGGLTIGSGGPKLQFASSAQEPERLQPVQVQSPSTVHAPRPVPGLPLTQCLPGPAATVQVSRFPVLRPSRFVPLMWSIEVEPSGMRPPAMIVPLPPPK